MHSAAWVWDSNETIINHIEEEKFSLDQKKINIFQQNYNYWKVAIIIQDEKRSRIFQR